MASSSEEGQRKKPKEIVCAVCRINLKRDCSTCCWQCKRAGLKLPECKSAECGGKLYRDSQYYDRDFYLVQILREKAKGKFRFFEHDQSGLTDEFFSEMVYPGYLETLSRDTDTGPLLTFRSQLALFDPVVMFSKVAIMALYRLFSLVEQVVSGMGKDSPGGKSCSIVLDKPVWLFPLSLWLVSRRSYRAASSLRKRGLSLSTQI